MQTNQFAGNQYLRAQYWRSKLCTSGGWASERVCVCRWCSRTQRFMRTEISELEFGCATTTTREEERKNESGKHLKVISFILLHFDCMEHMRYTKNRKENRREREIKKRPFRSNIFRIPIKIIRCKIWHGIAKFMLLLRMTEHFSGHPPKVSSGANSAHPRTLANRWQFAMLPRQVYEVYTVWKFTN